MIQATQPTLLFDEVDAIFSKRAQERGIKDDLRALLNTGYRRGGRVLRMGGGNNTTLESFEVFGAKRSPGSASLPHTLASRCLRIELKRRRTDEPVSDFFPQDVAEEAAALREWLEKWTATTIDTLAAARPGRVDGLRDRTNEVWRPLLAIAEEAGEVWAAGRDGRRSRSPEATTTKPRSGSCCSTTSAPSSRSGRWNGSPTADLIRALADFEESPWTEWWVDRDGEPAPGAPRKLAHRLRPFGIRSNITVRIGEQTAKGYRREDFLDAWERFLPARVEESHQSHQSQPAPHGQTDVTDVTDVADRREALASRFCDECDDPHRCAAELWCQLTPRITVEER